MGERQNDYTAHLENRWRNSHVLVYHGSLLSHFLGVAPSTFTTVHEKLGFSPNTSKMPLFAVDQDRQFQFRTYNPQNLWNCPCPNLKNHKNFGNHLSMGISGFFRGIILDVCCPTSWKSSRCIFCFMGVSKNRGVSPQNGL